ncbi:MAG: acyl--CoA ligase, partial [Clostridia bacterium]|nr:acyl--CoA ligase [Clostridia bacterium]
MQLKNVPSVRDLLDAAPEKFNNRTFIKYKRSGEVVEKSFGEVRLDSLAFCRMLRSTFPEKAHIAIISKSCYEYIVSLTGAIISGNTAVPVPPDTTDDEVCAILNDADITAVLYEPEFAGKTKSIKERCPQVKTFIDLGSEESFERIYREYGEDSPYASLSDFKTDPEECSLIIYTSGTTGEKKGVMLSQKALVGNLMYKPYSDIVVRDDVILSVLPLYHIFCFVSD